MFDLLLYLRSVPPPCQPVKPTLQSGQTPLKLTETGKISLTSFYHRFCSSGVTTKPSECSINVQHQTGLAEVKLSPFLTATEIAPWSFSMGTAFQIIFLKKGEQACTQLGSNEDSLPANLLHSQGCSSPRKPVLLQGGTQCCPIPSVTTFLVAGLCQNRFSELDTI